MERVKKPAAKKQRKEHDNYPTPLPVADAIVETLAQLITPPEVAIEPSAGNGAFVRALKKHWPNVFVQAVEMRAEELPHLEKAGADQVFIGDWVEWAKTSMPQKRVLVTGNPPFKFAEAHVNAAMENMVEGSHLAFLLRLSFLGSTKRAKSLWDRQGLRYFIPLTPRPQFQLKGNDNSEYATYVWEKGYTGLPQILPHIFWR